MAKHMRRWLCCLTDVDVQCIKNVMERHGHSSRASAVRFAILRQAERSRRTGAIKEYQSIRSATEEGVGHARSPEQVLERWQQLYTPEQLEAIEYLQARHKLSSKSQAVRFALRGQAVADGYALPAGPAGECPAAAGGAAEGVR